MKIISSLILSVFCLTIFLTPFIDLFGAFIDLVKINSAIIVSSRAASHMGAEDRALRDVEVDIDKNNFEDLFRQNINAILKLRDDYEPNLDKECKINKLEVDIQPVYIDDYGFEHENYINSEGEVVFNCFKINVRTKYMFKTNLMRKFSSNFKKTPYMGFTRIERLNTVN